MISGEDDSSALNGRLRPRKATVTTPNPPSKFSSKSEKVAPDKPKRNSSPSKASPNNHDDLTAKADSSSIAQFLCPLCDKKFTNKVSFKRHTRRLHQIFLKCIYCNYIDAPSDEDLMRHMVDNHPNQYFACLTCTIRFNSTTELAEHKLTTCEKPISTVVRKLRQKQSSESQKNQEAIKANEKVPIENKEPILEPEFNALVISCELKPSLVHDTVDIEEKITTNLILPSNINKSGMEQKTVLILDDIQWNKRIPPNFSFRNADADQILSRLGVVHRSPRVGESTRKDWLKLMDDSSQKFEKCFETSFYTRVASNVQENLAKFLDGSFNFSPDPDKIIKTRKSKSSAVINTAEGFPILLPYEQYSRNRFDGYIPRAIAPKHKWKWDSSENEKNMILEANIIKRDNHVDNCIITLISSLDIWTQLRMRHKFEGIFCKSSTEKSEKQNIVGNQLKEILESREIPSTSRAVEEPSSSTTAVVAVTDKLDFPSVLGLAARGSVVTKVSPTPAVLSGEWVRPRCYVCCACGEQSREARALSAHVAAHHPNAQVQHYEIVGESLLNADILKHLYVPPSQVSNRTRPLRGYRDCTKCKKSITMEDMHQHMLDCAGDTPTVRRKCRSRLFGVRKRRPRLADNPIARKKLRKDLRSHRNQKTLLRARPRIRTEVGDAETIRKMIADLPAKRHRSANEPSATQQILRPRRKLDIQRNKLKIKRLTSLERPTKKPSTNTEINESPIIDEDDQPLKPKTKSKPEKLVHTKKRFSTRVVASRNKKESTTAKELPTSNEKGQDVSSGSASQQNRVSRENTTQRLNINVRGNDSGEGQNRNSSDKNYSDQRDKSPGENREDHKNGVSDPPALKHSINIITALANTELQQINSPEQSTTEETPSDTRQVFLENEVGSSILDKPPLQKDQKKISEKKRLSLLNCIEKIKSQQKGENMFQRPEMMRKDQNVNEPPNLSLLDPHPAVISRTRDETGAANNVIPGNIGYQYYPAPRLLGMATQPMANETIMYNRAATYYNKINPDLEMNPPNAKSGRRRRKSSAVRMSPGRIDYEQATQLHYNHLLQQQQWNTIHNLPMMQSSLLGSPLAPPQRLPYSDNMLMQLHTSEGIKSGYPMQYKSIGFPLPLPYPTGDLHYDGRRDNAFQRVENGTYPSAPPISPQAWAANIRPPNEQAIPVSLPKSSNNIFMSIPRRVAKRSSESSDIDFSSAQSLSESSELRNSSDNTLNLFKPPITNVGRGAYYNNKRPMISNEIVYHKTPDYTDYSVDYFRNNYENKNANDEEVSKEGENYRTAQSEATAVSDPYNTVLAEERLPISCTTNKEDTTNQDSNCDLVPKSLFTNNSNKKVFHERYLAEHPHLSPSVPTESQAAKITTPVIDSTSLESYEKNTHVQNGEDNIQSLKSNPNTRHDLNNHPPYIEVGDERDECETLLDEPDSSLCEQPLDLSGKSAAAHGAKSNDYEDINRDATANKKSYEDVQTDLSLKDDSVFVKNMAHDFQHFEKPLLIEQDNVTPIQETLNSQLSCNVNKSSHIDKSETISHSKEVISRNNHNKTAFVTNVENIETLNTSSTPSKLKLNNLEEIVSHPPSDLLDRELFLARERVRLLEEYKSTYDKLHNIPEIVKNSDDKQTNVLNQDVSQNLESTKKKYITNLSTIILPESTAEFNNENAITAVKETKYKEVVVESISSENTNIKALSKPTENGNNTQTENSQSHGILGSIIPDVTIAAAETVIPENSIPQKAKETSAYEFTPALCDAAPNSYDNKLTVNTSSLPISSILPKKRHSPSARIHSQETQAKVILNQTITHFNKSEIESEVLKIITAPSYEENTKKLCDNSFPVQNKDEVSDQIIDLTEDDLNNANTTKTVDNSSELTILNLTPKRQTITKPFNEKTASLRAVRIKTLPSRKSQSEDLQQVSKESYIKPLLDISKKDFNILPTLNYIDKSTTNLDIYNANQLKDVKNIESHDTNEIELRQSLDKVIKPFDETKVQSKTSKEACYIESSEKINHLTAKTQLPSVEHVITVEQNITKEKCKETETENYIQKNIVYDDFVKTSESKPDHESNNDKGEIVVRDSLLLETSSMSLEEKTSTVLPTEFAAQQSKISKENTDSSYMDNQLEKESAESSPKTNKSSKLESLNKVESDDDDVVLASIAKQNNSKKYGGATVENPVIAYKKDLKKEETDTNPKQKKTSKIHTSDKKSSKKKSSKVHYKSRSHAVSTKFHKEQIKEIPKVSEPQYSNYKTNSTAQDSIEINTVKVDYNTETYKKDFHEKVPHDKESDCDNLKEINSDKKESSDEVYKAALAKSLDQSHDLRTRTEESDEVEHIKNIEVILKEAESLEDPNSTPTINENSSQFNNPVKNQKNNELNINDANLETDDNNIVEEIDPISAQIVPVTKKQLIFSKLLHEENKQEETKQTLALNTTDDEAKVEITTGTKVSTKRKKSSKKSKNKKRKPIEGINNEELSKTDTEFANISPKKKRRSSSLLSKGEEKISMAKKSKLSYLGDVTIPQHLDSTSYDLTTSANIVTSGADTEITEAVKDKSKEIQIQPEKANTSAETRTACYNRPINKSNNFASTHIKNPKNYDPYDIDLEIDMAETERPVVKRKGNKTVSGNNNTKTSKKTLIRGDFDKHRENTPKAPFVVTSPLNDSDSSISDTPLQKYVEEKEKSKMESLISLDSKKLEKDTSIITSVSTTDGDNIVLSEPSTEEPNYNNNNDKSILEMNLETECNSIIATNYIEYSDKTKEAEKVEVVASIKGCIEEKHDISKDNLDNEQSNMVSETFTGKSNTKQKKSRRSLSSGKSEAMNSEKSDQQLSSDKYMENFGFFSFRQPRNANLLATKKISETYNMIENDDADFRPRERQKKHLHNESKKVLTNGTHSSRTTQENNNSIDRRISEAPSTSSMNITESNIIDEHNPMNAANDDEVDLITAQRMLESEEIRKLERDLYVGFKEAAEANAGKTSGFNYLRAEETRSDSVNQNVVDSIGTQSATNHVESRELSPDKEENLETPESPEGVLIDKPLMYPEEEVNIYEDKYDIIKRRREASANAKQLLKVDKPKKSNGGITKKKPDKKNKRSLKKPVYQISQVRTKGALKGFDGIKISIATQDLKMPPCVSPPHHKQQKDSIRKARLLSASSNKSDADSSAAVVTPSDIYEFQDDEKPVAKDYRLSRKTRTSRDKSRSSSSEHEKNKHQSNYKGKEKNTLLYGEGKHSKKLDKTKGKKRYKGKKRRNNNDDINDERPREESKRIRKDKPKYYKGRDKNKVAEPENERTADPTLAEGDVFSNENNASPFDNEEPFYDSDNEMPSVPGTSGFVPDRNDESSYDSDSSSPPLSSVLKGPYACTCLSEIDSDDSETERGCAYRSCRYSHLNAAKNAVMGKIFKNNAVRCDKINKKPESPQPKPDLDRLFDSLLEPTNDGASTSTIVPIAGPSSANLFYYTTEANSQSKITKTLQENNVSNVDDDSNIPHFTKDTEQAFPSTSLFETDESKIDDASNIYNFSENTEESTDNGRYVMVSEKPVQTEDPEQLPRPEIAQEGPDDVEPESSDFIVLKRKTNAQKSRGTQTKRFSKSDVETSSHDGELNAAKIAKKYRKANKKHKSHHKRNKTSEGEEKYKPSIDKTTSAKPLNSETKQVRGTCPSPKPSTSRISTEITSQDNSANSSCSPRQRASQKGLAEGRARRKCTVGKQNVLAEHWSSSESDAGAGPSQAKGRKSSVVKKSSRGKKDQVCKRSQGEVEERPRAPVLKLLGRTASSLNKRARARGLEERHGWIVGQSGKKLVSMLAYNKMLQQLRRKRLRLQRRRRRRREREIEEEEEREREREAEREIGDEEEVLPDTDDDEPHDDNDED